MQPEVTVAVPVYNAARTLSRLLDALGRQQTSRAFEVVMVDDGSTDATPALLRLLPAGFRSVRQENAGPAAARNRAAREGHGAVILFTDSDCVPRPDWVETMAGCLAAHPEAGAVGGSYDIANPRSPLARLIHAEIHWRHAQMGRTIRFAGSYNLAVRRHVFEALGGFSTRYRAASAEDNDFSYRLLAAGWKIFFCRDSLVAHHHTERLGKYLREQHRHGKWRAVLYCDHPAMATGDGYTRWTDVAEVPLALGVLGGIALGLFSSTARWGAGLMGALLAVLELRKAALIFGTDRTALASFVGLGTLRAFARALGFASGFAGAKAIRRAGTLRGLGQSGAGVDS